jgi:hypothetical protein
MTTTQIINNTLWRELRKSINRAYADCSKESLTQRLRDDLTCLRDYAENISWSDALEQLLERETLAEKQHRGTRSVVGFSAGTAARLILMQNVVKGANMTKEPRATEFLVLRQTAVEAEVIGWIMGAWLDPNWIKAVESYDYAKLMKDAA